MSNYNNGSIIDIFDMRPVVKEPKKHPLINKESSHYQMVDGVESILLMEKLFTREELMTWAKLTSYKYRFRLAKKNVHGDMDKAILSDAKEIQTYEDYYRYLGEQDG